MYKRWYVSIIVSFIRDIKNEGDIHGFQETNVCKGKKLLVIRW